MSEGDELLKVEADQHKIDQVLVNTINNAVKYALASKVINISFEQQGDMVRVAVTNNGRGLNRKRCHIYSTAISAQTTAVINIQAWGLIYTFAPRSSKSTKAR